MATFPMLTRAVSHRGWKESKLIDPTIRSEFVSGAIATRARFSGTLPVLYNVTYHHISPADKVSLEAFEDSIDVGVTTFNWYNILTATMWTMRLHSPIQFGLEPNCIDKYYAQIEMFGSAGSSSSSSVSSSSSSSSSLSSSSSSLSFSSSSSSLSSSSSSGGA